jgi:ABC-type Mn2+/Zn2+ transport system permease subunit
MHSAMLSPAFLALAVAVALAAGITGSFALMKGITLAGDVISHIALPGIGIALLLRINPLIGGAATLLIGTLLIARLEDRTGLATETTIGVVFVGSLALGALITPGKDLEEALFGNFSVVSFHEFVAGFVGAMLVIGVLWSRRHQLILHLFSPELAASLGVNGQRLNLTFLLLFSLTVLLELTFLGALLASALIMIPPALARRLTHRLVLFIGLSALVSACSMTGGIALAAWRGLPLGPAVVAVASLLFLCSLPIAER